MKEKMRTYYGHNPPLLQNTYSVCYEYKREYSKTPLSRMHSILDDERASEEKKKKKKKKTLVWCSFSI